MTVEVENVGVDIPWVVEDLLSQIGKVHSGVVKVGLVGSVRNVFQVKLGYERFRDLANFLINNPWIKLVLGDDDASNFFAPPKGTLDSNEASMKHLRSIDSVVVAGQLKKTKWVIKRFIDEEVDVVLIVPLNYGDEEATAEIGRRLWRARRCPVYTYVMPEVAISKDGSRQLDDGCGIFPARTLLNLRMGVEAGYIPKSEIGSPEFNAGLTSMLRVAGGVMAARNVRAIQIGPDQPTFYAIRENPYDLWEKLDFRYETIEGGDFQREISAIVTKDPAWLDGVVMYISRWMDFTGVREEFPLTAKYTAAAFVRVLQLLVEKESNAVTINCWDSIMKNLRFMVCGVNGLLFMHGIPAPCETDRLGVVGCAMLQGMSLGRTGGFFADLTRFEPDTGLVLWWHCGPFGCAHCRGVSRAKVGKGWIIPCPNGCAGLVDGAWGEIGQPVSLVQLRPDTHGNLELLATNGKICEGSNTIGTHFWFRVASPRHFEEWVSDHPFDHHNSGVLGVNVIADIPEVAKWLDVPHSTYDNISMQEWAC